MTGLPQPPTMLCSSKLATPDYSRKRRTAADLALLGANLKGTRFGSWEVLGEPAIEKQTGAETRIRRQLFVHCYCHVTQKTKPVNLESLLRNLSTGARGAEKVKYLRAYQDPAEQARIQILGGRYDAIYQRCNNPNHEWFPAYGGRGIQLRFSGREHFVNWVRANLPHETYQAVQIDRIDNNRHYEPGNLRLVSQQQNLRNTRRNRYYPYQGMNVVAADLWHLLKTDYPDFSLSPTRTAKLAALGIPVSSILTRKPKPNGRTSTTFLMPDPAIVSLYRAA